MIYVILILENFSELILNAILLLIAFGWKIILNRSLKNLISVNKDKLMSLALLCILDSLNRMIILNSKSFLLEGPFIAYLFAFYVFKIIYLNKIAGEASKKIRYNTLIHLYFFEDYHKKANAYKINFMHNFKFFNLTINLTVLLFESGFEFFNNFSGINYSHYENKIILRVVMTNIFVLLIILLFTPPDVRLNEKYYLRKSQYPEAFCSFEAKMSKNFFEPKKLNSDFSLFETGISTERNTFIDKKRSKLESEDIFDNQSFCSLRVKNIDDISEDYFKPYLIINPIFKEVEDIKRIDILKSSSIGYLETQC